MSRRIHIIIFVVFCIIEGIVIISLVFHSNRQLSITSPYRRFSITPLSKSILYFPTNSKLKHYWELQPNTQKEDDLSYMGLSGIVIHTINTDGLNERKDYSIVAPPRTFRIVTLGDSFTEGAFVETSKNYSEVLEDMLNTRLRCKNIDNYEVINLGVSGYDMQYNLERVKRKAIKYHPDLSILWTDENDYISHNEKYFELVSIWNPITEAPDIVSMYKEQGDFTPEANAIWYKFNSLHRREDLITEELGYLRELLSIYTGPVLIFSLDSMGTDIRQPIQLTVNNRGATYFFPEIPPSYSKFPDYHPSVIGHQQFAEFLWEKLIEHRIIPCQPE